MMVNCKGINYHQMMVNWKGIQYHQMMIRAGFHNSTNIKNGSFILDTLARMATVLTKKLPSQPLTTKLTARPQY